MKFLNLQTIIQGYLCLGHTTTNHHHHSHLKELRLVDSKPVVKVIKADGVVDIYTRSITASELMLQFPKHLVCDSQSFYIGQKIPPLSPSHKLKLGHNYFLLPLQFFESVLSFVTMASSFASLNTKNSASASLSAITSSCQVFDIRKAPSGYLQIRVSDEFVSKLMQQEKTNIISKSSPICTTTELQKDYTQLVTVRQWKPKLETITESKRKRVLSSSSFGIKRKKKTSIISKQQRHDSTATVATTQKWKKERHHQKAPKIKKIKAKKIKGL